MSVAIYPEFDPPLAGSENFCGKALESFLDALDAWSKERDLPMLSSFLVVEDEWDVGDEENDDEATENSSDHEPPARRGPIHCPTSLLVALGTQQQDAELMASLSEHARQEHHELWLLVKQAVQDGRRVCLRLDI